MDYDIEKDEYMKDWKEVRLGDVVNIQSGYSFKASEFGEIGIPVIKIKNVNGKFVDTNDCRFWCKNKINMI